jgi:uncharacterized protein
MTRAVLAAVMLACSMACGGSSAQPQSAEPPAPTAPPGGVVVRFGTHDLGAEVAATPRARAQGLMFRESLGRDAGMLFLFPVASRGGFWMKNTLIPLSIAFMTRTAPATYRVIAILDMQPCRTAVCPSYSPRAPFDAAVEAPLGWYASHDVRPGAVAKVVDGAEPKPV